MLWKKKKEKEGLPDLPSTPTMPPSMNDYNPPKTIPISPDIHEQEDPHPLPSFPDSPMQKGFSQSAIKDAITQKDQGNQLPPLPGQQDPSPSFPTAPAQNSPPQMQHPSTTNKPEKEYKVIEMEEWQPQQPSHHEEDDYKDIGHPPDEHEHEEDMEVIPKPPPAPMPKIPERKQIFVRIDKFREARDSLEIVKSKLTDIDDLLKTIRDVKQKEDHELSSWEKEVESIKARVGHISKEIFDNAY